MRKSDPNYPARGGADESNILESLGFGTPAPPAAPPAAPPPGDSRVTSPATSQSAPASRAIVPAPSNAGSRSTSRREARDLERRPSAGKSAARRIRAIEKSRVKANAIPRGSRVVVTKARRPRNSNRARSIGSRLLSLGAMIFAGALAVGMSVPANAFNPGAEGSLFDQAAAVQADQGESQSMEVGSTVTTGSAARDEYTVTSWAEMLRLQYGTRDYSYELGDPNGPIRWPFPYAVPISSGFGERQAPCRGCSSMHMGVDFTPGEGAPIYAVADGVVTTHLEDEWGFGNHVIITHEIDGQTVTSTYAHMQYGSSPLEVGDEIKVGDFIGTVGQTGTATGNHLHFEIAIEGVQVDPFAWLKAHT